MHFEHSRSVFGGISLSHLCTVPGIEARAASNVRAAIRCPHVQENAVVTACSF
jgi:hypothetical protein